MSPKHARRAPGAYLLFAAPALGAAGAIATYLVVHPWALFWWDQVLSPDGAQVRDQVNAVPQVALFTAALLAAAASLLLFLLALTLMPGHQRYAAGPARPTAPERPRLAASQLERAARRERHLRGRADDHTEPRSTR